MGILTNETWRERLAKIDERIDGGYEGFNEVDYLWLRQALSDLQGFAAKVMTKLDGYGPHRPWCAALVDNRCNCGWPHVLEALREEQAELDAFSTQPPLDPRAPGGIGYDGIPGPGPGE